MGKFRVSSETKSQLREKRGIIEGQLLGRPACALGVFSVIAKDSRYRKERQEGGTQTPTVPMFIKGKPEAATYPSLRTASVLGKSLEWLVIQAIGKNSDDLEQC